MTKTRARSWDGAINKSETGALAVASREAFNNVVIVSHLGMIGVALLAVVPFTGGLNYFIMWAYAVAVLIVLLCMSKVIGNTYRSYMESMGKHEVNMSRVRNIKKSYIITSVLVSVSIAIQGTMFTHMYSVEVKTGRRMAVIILALAVATVILVDVSGDKVYESIGNEKDC